MRAISIILLLLHFSFHLFSQQQQLSDYIRYALQHRIEMAKNNIDIKAQIRQYTHSKRELLPSVSASLYHQFSSGRSLNLNNYSWENSSKQQGSISLDAELIIFNGLQSYRKIEMSKLLTLRSHSVLDKQRNDICVEVIKAYSQWLAYTDNAQLMDEIIANTSERIQKLTIAVSAGKTSEVDLMEMQAQKEKQLKDRIDTQRAIESASIELQKAMNATSLPTHLPSVELDTLAVTLVADPIIIYQKAITTLPEFRLSSLDSAYRATSLKSTKGAYLPILKLNSSIASQYLVDAINPADPTHRYRFGDQLGNNRYWQTGVSLSIPIYNRHLYKSQVVEANRVYLQTVSDKQKLLNDVRYEIEQLCNDLTAKQQLAKNLAGQVKLYNTILSMRQKQYDTGALSINDLVMAQTNYTQSLLNYHTVCHQITFAFELLNLYTNPHYLTELL